MYVCINTIKLNSNIKVPKNSLTLNNLNSYKKLINKINRTSSKPIQ